MTDDIDLVQRTKCALEHFGDSPWLPDVTGDLVRVGWRAIFQEARLTRSDYGTSRVITKSALSHRNVVGHLSATTAVEVLDKSLAAYWAGNGIEFYTASEIGDANLLVCVEEALNLISRVPTLRATVDALVRSVHLIRPDNDDYDVSFSHPLIPFSIFVSVPRQREPINSLRIAEAIVHEAMHLQLTLIERVVPLINSSNRRYFSPWRDEYRPVQGLLHAFYVFNVIARFIETLLPELPLCLDCAHYLEGRRYEIKKQMREIDSFRGCPDLTMCGKSLLRGLFVSAP